jgi:hypothetical protein
LEKYREFTKEIGKGIGKKKENWKKYRILYILKKRKWKISGKGNWKKTVFLIIFGKRNWKKYNIFNYVWEKEIGKIRHF